MKSFFFLSLQVYGESRSFLVCEVILSQNSYFQDWNDSLKVRVSLKISSEPRMILPSAFLSEVCSAGSAYRQAQCCCRRSFRRRTAFPRCTFRPSPRPFDRRKLFHFLFTIPPKQSSAKTGLRKEERLSSTFSILDFRSRLYRRSF